MKNTLLALLFLLPVIKLSAQFKEQKVKLLEKYSGAECITFEDSVIIENNPIIEIEEPVIVFYKFMVDTSTCKVRVTGKLNHPCKGLPPSCGIPEIGIFKAVRNKNTLTTIVDLGNTSNDKST